MPSFRTGVVTSITAERAGLQRVMVDDEPAVVLTQLVGPVAPGDRVVVNTTAVELGLGTGGNHFVHWNLSREAWTEPGPGHVMKLRYTSLQVDTGSGEEWEDADDGAVPTLGGMPVVACGVHSQVACVAAAFKANAPDARLVYVMTDGAALPLALSDLVDGLVHAGFVDGTVTCGHAFGGEVEAVNIHSALWLARYTLGADAAVVAVGPGVVGTGTALGTTALDVVGTLDAAAALGGHPIICVRASGADERDRHRGVSHHTTTALSLVRSAVHVPVPSGCDLPPPDPPHVFEPLFVPDIAAVLGQRGVTVTSMGRTPADDPLFFSVAGAAGVSAALAVGP